MLLWEIFRVAFGAILANKLRSILTMLGIVIGIAAVITMVALGEGAQRSVQERLSTLGSNIVSVRPGQSFMGGVGQGSARLDVADAEALAASEGGAIRAVSPELEGRLQVEYGAANANLSVVGTWPDYFTVNNFTLGGGRLYNDTEDRGRRRVAVLGALVASELGLGNQSLLGETIRIKGVPFEVIGVLAEKGSQGFSNPDEGIYVPLGTAQMRLLGTDRIRTISVQAADSASMDAAMAEVDRVLRRTHRIRPGQDADFSVRNQTTLLATVQETTKTMSFLLAGIATISLLVGGIGIMNIMLVSVTERTREIGLRKSLGARRRDILLQFLIEAVTLCLSGGLLGLGVGVAGSVLLRRLAGWQVSVSAEAVLLAVGFSAVVGIFFGLWPARRAARLDPVEALRFE